MADALNRTNRFKYDAAGRLLQTIYANHTGVTNQFDAAGQRERVTDQAGLATQFGYDVSGQLTNVIKPIVPDPENNYNQGVPAALMFLLLPGGASVLASRAPEGAPAALMLLLLGLGIGLIPREKWRLLVFELRAAWQAQWGLMTAPALEGGGRRPRRAMLRLPSLFWRLATIAQWMENHPVTLAKSAPVSAEPKGTDA